MNFEFEKEIVELENKIVEMKKILRGKRDRSFRRDF